MSTDVSGCTKLGRKTPDVPSLRVMGACREQCVLCLPLQPVDLVRGHTTKRGDHSMRDVVGGYRPEDSLRTRQVYVE